MKFNADFFVEHQRPLLGFLNSNIGGALRRSLWIPEYQHPLVKLTPNAAHVLLPDGKIKVVLYSNKQYAQAIHRNYKPIWEALHWWDMRLANRWVPAWNAGFDTYTSQPDETGGFDNWIQSNAATTNNGTDTEIRVGESSTVAAVWRGLIKFDLTSIPSGSTTSSNILSLWIFADDSSNARDFKAFRVLRNWSEGNSTWNNYDTGSAWTTAGAGSDGNDTDLTTAWATVAYTATESVGTEKQYSLSTTEFDKFLNSTYTNYGWLIKADTENNDAYRHDSSSSATSSERPKLVVTYTPGSSGKVIWFG